MKFRICHPYHTFILNLCRFSSLILCLLLQGFLRTKLRCLQCKLLMLSGRYRCGHLTWHWSKTETGHCSLSSRCVDVDVRNLILFHCDTTSPSFCVFLLDCSCLPDVIMLVQKYGSDILKNIFEVTRTWTFTLHRERLKLLERWSRVRLWCPIEMEDDLEPIILHLGIFRQRNRRSSKNTDMIWKPDIGCFLSV